MFNPTQDQRVFPEGQLLSHGVPAPVFPREVVVALSSLHSGGPQYRSRHPVETGAEARGMEAPPWGREFGQAQVDLFASRETSHCPLWFSLTHPAPLGLDEMVQTWPRLRLYMRNALKWKVFTSWCSDRQLDPVNCPVGTVQEFLQDGFTAGLTPSTLKVYVTAISAYHIPLGGMPLGKGISFPPWYFEAEACSSHQGADMGSGHCPARPFLAPFELLEEVPNKFLTLKALFLLAVSSLKRIGDLQALSVAPLCLEFAPSMVKAFPKSCPVVQKWTTRMFWTS